MNGRANEVIPTPIRDIPVSSGCPTPFSRRRSSAAAGYLHSGSAAVLAGETPAPRELLVSLNIALIFVHPPDLVIIGEVKCTPTYMGHTMSEEKSVSHWIAELQHGNREAAQHLWEKYFTQIVRFAAQKLRGSRRRAVDEEDVALSAIHSALRKIEAGK